MREIRTINLYYKKSFISNWIRWISMTSEPAHRSFVNWFFILTSWVLSDRPHFSCIAHWYGHELHKNHIVYNDLCWCLKKSYQKSSVLIINLFIVELPALSTAHHSGSRWLDVQPLGSKRADFGMVLLLTLNNVSGALLIYRIVA